MSLPVFVEPSRCEGKLSPRMWDDPNFVAEEKMDGVRCVLYSENGKVRAIQRGTKNDKAFNLPHIVEALSKVSGVIIDGELVVPGGRFSDAAGIMNSNPTMARVTQGTKGFLQFVAFDLMFVDGQDIRKKPLKERRAKLEEVIKSMDSEHIVLVSQISDGKKKFYEDILKAGGEGCVLKDTRLCYGNEWVKAKAITDVSVVISGIAPDKKSIYMSVFDKNGLRSVGSCATTALKIQMGLISSPAQYVGRVLDVKAYGISNEGQIRNPVWLRMRPDLDPKTVTFEKLKKDIDLNKR